MQDKSTQGSVTPPAGALHGRLLHHLLAKHLCGIIVPSFLSRPQFARCTFDFSAACWRIIYAELKFPRLSFHRLLADYLCGINVRRVL